MLSIVETFGPWAVGVAGAALCYLLAGRRWTLSGTQVVVLSLVWVALVQAEGIFPGPLSRLEWGDGDRLFIAYFGWLAKQGNAPFLPELAGGADRYAFGRIGGEFFSVRLLLLQLLPLWAVTVVSRITVTLSGIAGIYLFAHRLLRCPRGVALAFGMLYATAYEFTVGLTFLYGFSIAGLPLLLFALFAFRNDVRGWLELGVLGALYIGTTDPIYWLPLLWACVVCLWLWIRPVSAVLAVGGLLALTVLWLANYAETLFAFFQFLPWSERGSGGSEHAPDLVANLLAQLDYMLRPVLSFNYAGWPFGLPLIFALIASIAVRSWRVAVAAGTALALAVATVPLQAMPWSALGVPFLATYRWYLQYGAFGMGLLAGAAGVAAFVGRNHEWRVARWAASLALGIAAGMLFSVKIHSGLQTLTRGTFASLTEIPNLKQADWRTDTAARVVSLPTQLDPNAMVNYGLSTFDGAATLMDRNIHRFWSAGVMRGANLPSREMLGFGLNSDFIQCCQPLDIDRLADLKLLRLAGVGYLLSYRKLQSADLTQVSGPAEQESTHALRFLLAPPQPVFVYKLAAPLPVAWRATEVTVLPETADDTALFGALETQALQGQAIVRSGEPQVRSESSGVAPLSAKRTGSTIEIATAGVGGPVLINQTWLPWWSAVTDTGENVSIRSANLIHMLLDVPQGARSVVLSYRRPLFWAQVFKASHSP
jgi:hypothetical protein